MKKTIDFFKEENFRFICHSSKMMNYDGALLQSLKRADSIFEKVRYDGLQTLDFPLGFIFIEPLSAQGILTAIDENPKLLYEFMDEVHTDRFGVREDNSRVEVSFKDKFYGNYKIGLDIFKYTFGREDSFKPVENPLILKKDIKLERWANLEFDIC